MCLETWIVLERMKSPSLSIYDKLDLFSPALELILFEMDVRKGHLLDF